MYRKDARIGEFEKTHMARKMTVTQLAAVISSHMLLFRCLDLKSRYQGERKEDTYRCSGFLTLWVTHCCFF